MNLLAILSLCISAQARITIGTAVPVGAGITEMLVNGESIIKGFRHPHKTLNTFGTKIKAAVKSQPAPSPNPFPVPVAVPAVPSQEIHQ